MPIYRKMSIYFALTHSDDSSHLSILSFTLLYICVL